MQTIPLTGTPSVSPHVYVNGKTYVCNVSAGVTWTIDTQVINWDENATGYVIDGTDEIVVGYN